MGKIQRTMRENLSLILFVLVMGLVRTTFANQYFIPTGSMIPTLEVGDVIIVNRVAYDLKVPFSDITIAKFDDPERGDVVVFEGIEEPKTTLVKRLIGIPGDHIRIDDGRIFLNGDEISKIEFGRDVDGSWQYEETLNQHPFTVRRVPHRVLKGTYEFTVPADHYFMMGDNRDESHDGRVFGFVPRSNLIGRAHHVLFSWKMNPDRIARDILS